MRTGAMVALLGCWMGTAAAAPAPGGLAAQLGGPGRTAAGSIDEGPAGTAMRSAVPPGTIPAMGDLVTSKRAFGTWTVECEALLSAGGRTCRLRAESGEIEWSVGLTTALQPILVIRGPASLSAGDAVMESSAGDTAVRSFRCDGTGCSAAVAFKGAFASELGAGRPLVLRWGPGGSRTSPIAGSGFPEAVASLSTPDGEPFGTVACGPGRSWRPADPAGDESGVLAGPR